MESCFAELIIDLLHERFCVSFKTFQLTSLMESWIWMQRIMMKISDREEAGDSNCLGNQQLSGSEFSDASGDGSSEVSNDDYEPVAKG